MRISDGTIVWARTLSTACVTNRPALKVGMMTLTGAVFITPGGVAPLLLNESTVCSGRLVSQRCAQAREDSVQTRQPVRAGPQGAGQLSLCPVGLQYPFVADLHHVLAEVALEVRDPAQPVLAGVRARRHAPEVEPGHALPPGPAQQVPDQDVRHRQ